MGPNLVAVPQLLFIVAAVVLGGPDTCWGPLIGIAALMVADEFMREFGAYRTLGLGLLIMWMVILRARLDARGRRA